MKTKSPLTLTIAAVSLFIVGAYPAIAGTFASTQSGSWGSAATWGGAGVPGCGDTVTISGGRRRNDRHQRHNQSGDRGIARQGQDYQEVPGPQLRGRGQHGPRARSAQVNAGRGHRARFRASVRGAPRQEQDGQRPAPARAIRQGGLPGHRPRPRRRGHCLARARSDRCGRARPARVPR